jgi:anti-sigma regulatory factor (Ser/Thr protein kinase)
MTWEMPADASNVPLCRKAVRLLLEHNLISDHDVDDAELVLGELCANVIRHAYEVTAGSMEIQMALNGLDLMVSVSDSGRGFDTRNRPATPMFSASGGMGFFLMEHLSDQVTIDSSNDKGSAVTATRRVMRR